MLIVADVDASVTTPGVAGTTRGGGLPTNESATFAFCLSVATDPLARSSAVIAPSAISELATAFGARSSCVSVASFTFAPVSPSASTVVTSSPLIVPLRISAVVMLSGEITASLPFGP